MKKIYKEWEKEFFQLDFRDKRLKNRFFQMMDSLSSSPEQSILSATGSRVSAKAAYRFFANETVSYKQLLESISRTNRGKIFANTNYKNTFDSRYNSNQLWKS